MTRWRQGQAQWAGTRARTLAAALLLAPGLLCAAGKLAPVATSPPAPALGLKDLGDREHHLDDYVGRVVLVNFWATWCRPCVAEMPGMQQLKTTLADQPFSILAVNFGEDRSEIQQFKDSLGLDFPLLLDPDTRTPGDWDVDFLPTSFLVDARGRLRYEAYGEVHWDGEDVRAKIDGLLRETDPGPKPGKHPD
jgi:thiol-disulfide isomerase/thioredoxin